MTQRLRRILIMIVMALLTVTLMAASLLCSVTYARYAGGKFNEEKSIYDQIIEFVGANQYEVYSPEELVEAIENGYSYIKIGEGAEQPFVITTGVTDVTANLVIDLNGTTIVRNSRNPVLDVQRNVSAVLVFDSSVKEGGDVAQDAGSFYNPVGSALQVSGGTLTVAAGRYDSGPKDGIATSLPSDTSDIISVTVHSRTSRTTQDGYSVSASASMPALSADVYLPETWTGTSNNYIEGDTYLIYSKEQNCYVDNGTLIVNAVDGAGDELAVPCNAASCDFYYYYPIDKDGNPIETGGTATAPQTYAVVYGYNDVKALAANDALDGTDLSKNGLVWPYAAVRSFRSTETVQEGEGRTTGGEGFMRGGAFSTYFGTENTYGIYAEGGTLTVAGGVTFTAEGEGVCIRSQTSSTTTDSNAAASLEISGGTFSSELGDTIQMEGGSVTITGGTFNKDASVTGAQTGEGANNGSAIDIQGGTLSASNAVFTVTGDHVNGIKMDKGTETGTETQTADVIKNVTFDFNQSDGGTYVAAIQVAGGTLEVSGSIFNFNKEASSNTAFSHNNGIYVRSSGEGDAAQSGTVTATGCTFTFGNNSNSSVTASAGIASVGGEVTAKNCTFKLPGYSNYGIYATGGETTVTGGSITMTGRDTTQIGSGENAARGNDNFGINISGGEVTVSGCEISVSGTYSSGVLATNGTVNLSGTNLDSTTITITNSQTTETENNQTISTLTSSAVSSEGGTINLSGTVEIKSDSLGITARGTINVGDETTQAAANVTVNTENATGVYVNNGTLNVNAGATLGVTSTVRSNTKWVQPPEGLTAIPPSIFNGVYVNGGSLNSTGTLNVDFTGVVSDATTDENGDNYNLGGAAYREFQVKSYAVRVEATTTTSSVTIVAGKITNSCGGGVLVNGGKVTLGTAGSTEGSANHLAVSATGNTYYGGLPIGGNGTDNWYYAPPEKGGDAVKVDGGTLTVDGGSYTAYYGNGILVTNGSATVNGGTFTGTDNRRYGTGLYTGAGSNYGLKVLGGSATVKGGSFTANGGGVFIMGENASTPQTQIISANINVSGATGVSVWNYANVAFGGTESTGLTVTAESTGLAVETTTANLGNSAKQKITINSGTFQSTGTVDNKNGIWYGNAGATLTINGGVFKGSGSGGLGLKIDANPGTRIQISSGTFIGGADNDDDNTQYGGGGAISGGSIGGVSTHDIIASGKACYYYDTEYRLLYYGNQIVGGPNSNYDSNYADVNLNAQVYYTSNGTHYSDFNDLGTIVVQ